ncbi:MAG: hypothetical protein AAGA67_08485, partial [Cyanobacteria bacterium P01_F01_bin.153]
MGTFFYYKRGDCPICAGAGHKPNKQCRSTTLNDTRLKVHCWAGGDAPKGWGYVGDDAHGIAQYIEGWRDRSNIDWDEIDRRKAEKAAQNELDRSKRSLVKERDTVYRKWQDSQRLVRANRAELERRGLTTDEIDFAQSLGWLRTWQQGAPLYGPSNIPGASGKGLYGSDGIAIAAPNVEGLIGGFQIKPDFQGDGPKYRWLTGCALRCDEQPMPVFIHPNRSGEYKIWVVEGFLKPLIVAFLAWRLGHTNVVVIGAGGSNWASHPKQWEQTLNRLQPKAIYLLPDAGVAENANKSGKSGPYKASLKLRSLLKGFGYDLRVKWWSQYSKEGKGNLDPDEVSTETILSATILPAVPTGAIQHWSQTPQLQALLVPGIGMPLEYRPGDRLSTWAWAEQQGINVLDTSEAGSGKSRAAGLFLGATPTGKQRIFASNEYRNPTDPALEGFPEMEAKHLGLVAFEVDGKTIRRTPKAGEAPNIAPSCLGAEVFHRAHEKGIPLFAGKNCATCQACPAAEMTRKEGELASLTCQHLGKKRATKDTPAYVTHPSNIAKPSDRFESQTVVVDE